MRLFAYLFLTVMTKQRRHAKILNLIQTRPVLSQIELGQRLKMEGVVVTQATLSRDLHALNLVKTPHGYKLPEQLRPAAGNSDQQRLTILQFMIEAEAAGNLVVVKTHPGNASPVARCLDTIGWKEIVGTLAGDDTILVVTANVPTARVIQRRLLALGDRK
jgi:transcriptional regulator of arginine metabolism